MEKKHIWRFMVIQEAEYEVVFDEELTLEQAEREFLSGGYMYISDIQNGKIAKIICEVEEEPE